MPATRLLVLADPKMLPVLANGLREGSKFDVLTLPFGDAGAAAAAQRADALAVFYGSPTQSLQSVVQELAPSVRSRGGRVVAVLQREQVANTLRGIEVQMGTIETAFAYLDSVADHASSGRDIESEIDAWVGRISPPDVLEAEVGSVLASALAPASMRPLAG